MKKAMFAFIVMSILMFTACARLGLGSLTSTTYIKPQDSFILGNNPHAPFSISLTNTSPHAISICQKPIDGITGEPTVVEPKKNIKVKVPSNTAVIIENASDESAEVALKVFGDTDLSMKYKN